MSLIQIYKIIVLTMTDCFIYRTQGLEQTVPAKFMTLYKHDFSLEKCLEEYEKDVYIYLLKDKDKNEKWYIIFERIWSC